MSRPAINRNDFWADAINSLLLRPVYRKPFPASVVRDAPANAQTRLSATTPSETGSVQKADTSKVEAVRMPDSPSSGSGFPLRQTSAEQTPDQADDIFERYPEVRAIYVKKDGGPLGTEDTDGEEPTESSGDQETAGGAPMEPQFPQQLNDLDIEALHRQGLGLIREVDHPKYLAEAALEEEYLDAARISRYGFPGPTASIVAAHLDGQESQVIARNLNISEDHVRKWINNAYTQFGVRNREGLLAAIQWIVAREAEEFARTVRERFEAEVINSLRDDESREPIPGRKIERRTRTRNRSKAAAPGRERK